MDENAVSIFVSDDEREFMDREIAAGKYADEQGILRAGLAALEHQEKTRALRRLIAEGDADIERGHYIGFNDPSEITQFVIGHAEAIRARVLESGLSGESPRQIPEIINSVKAKLRANGAL